MARWRLLFALLIAACGDGGTLAVAPELSLKTSALDFGETPVLVPREASLDVCNVGRAALTLSDFRIEPSTAPFRILASPGSVASGVCGSLRLAFAASAFGEAAGRLVFATDDPTRPEVALALAGRATTAGAGALSAELDFEGVCEGTAALGRVTLTSSGTAPLLVSAIALDPPDGAISLLGSTRTPLTLEVGASLVLIVRYAPEPGALDRDQATLIVDSADPDAPRREHALTGTPNRAPIASMKPFPALAPGALLDLDATESSDPDGDLPLSFFWRLSAAPAVSTSQPRPSDAARATLEIDAPGEYGVELVAIDAAGCASSPAQATALAQTAEGLRFELAWDNLESDLDLHLAPDPDPFFGASDCHYAEGQLRPDWGAPGDASDDPALVRDALIGYGPEIVSYPNPAPGRYRALVHYFADHRSSAPATTATLRMYRFGVLVSETRRLLPAVGAAWTALAVSWPGGSVELIDQCEACE